MFLPKKLFLLIPLFYFFVIYNLGALDFRVTDKELGFDLRGEYNRGLLYSVDASLLGAAEINGMYSISGGLSFGAAGGSFDIKSFLRADLSPFKPSFLSAGFAWIYNGLPGFETHTHTLLPHFSLNTKWAGIIIGYGIRYNEFFGELSLVETFLSFSIYANIVKNEKLHLQIVWANFDDFYAWNFGAYSLGVKGNITFNENWTMVNELTVLQSGSVALSSNFYGIVYRGGVRFSW